MKLMHKHLIVTLNSVYKDNVLQALEEPYLEALAESISLGNSDNL